MNAVHLSSSIPIEALNGEGPRVQLGTYELALLESSTGRYGASYSLLLPRPADVLVLKGHTFKVEHVLWSTQPTMTDRRALVPVAIVVVPIYLNGSAS